MTNTLIYKCLLYIINNIKRYYIYNIFARNRRRNNLYFNLLENNECAQK